MSIRAAPSSSSSFSDHPSALGRPAPDRASARGRNEAGANGSQLMEVNMTEETSRRGVFLAAAGLGAVGLGAALVTRAKQRPTAPRAQGWAPRAKGSDGLYRR